MELQITFAKRIDGTDTMLTEADKQAVEDILFEYHKKFARHRIDKRMDTEFKVKLTLKDEKSVYTKNLPMLMDLKEDLIVELAPMGNHGIITVLLFTEYANPNFARRKPSKILRLVVDLKKHNILIADYYTQNNRPVSTLSHRAEH